jgi:ADP-dependent glucokinase
MAQSISNVFSQSKIILVGPIGKKLREMLNKNNIQTPKETYKDEDEIHLILEYARNEKFEGIQSPNANRFIVSNDFFNSRLEMLDLFFELQEKYEKIDRIILAGLHLLEAQKNEFRREKLLMLNNHLSKLDGQIIHLELASVGDKNFMSEILDSVS